MKYLSSMRFMKYVYNSDEDFNLPVHLDKDYNVNNDFCIDFDYL